MKEKIALLASAFLFIGCIGNRHLPSSPYEQVALWSQEIGIKRSSITSINCCHTDSGRNTACSINYILDAKHSGEGISGRTYYATELLLCHEKRGCQKIPVDDSGHLNLISEEQ